MKLVVFSGLVSIVVGVVLGGGALLSGQWLLGIAGAVLVAAGVFQLLVARAFAPLSKLGLRAPTFAEASRSMDLASAMLARQVLRDTLRGSGDRVQMTLLEAVPEGVEWQLAPVYRLRVSYLSPSLGPVETHFVDPVPMPYVARLTTGSQWQGFADRTASEKVFIDW